MWYPVCVFRRKMSGCLLPHLFCPIFLPYRFQNMKSEQYSLAVNHIQKVLLIHGPCGKLHWKMHRDPFVKAPSQWGMTLHCNVISHWLGAFTKWSLMHGEVKSTHFRNWCDSAKCNIYVPHWNLKLYLIICQNHIKHDIPVRPTAYSWIKAVEFHHIWMKLLIHSQTSMAVPLKFGNGL